MADSEIQVGRELDAAIAEKVLQVKKPWGPERYSTRIEDALELAEWLRGQGWLVVLKLMPDGLPFMNDLGDVRIFARHFCELNYMRRGDEEGRRRYIYCHPFGRGKTLPEALCRAALMAYEWIREKEAGNG